MLLMRDQHRDKGIEMILNRLMKFRTMRSISPRFPDYYLPNNQFALLQTTFSFSKPASA